MSSSFKIFTLFGIEIRLHTAFVLLPLLFGWIYSRSGGWEEGLRAFVLVWLIFVLVIAHEISHSLTARKYGIPTQRITLYPIGGIASMYRIPRVPLQELLVAAAGPLLNFALAAVLFFPVQAWLGRAAFWSPDLASWRGLWANLYWANLALGIFNALPAFPMDGGRILRSVLALRLNYARATQISVILGQLFAILFFILALRSRHWMLLGIAVFIYFSASNEMRIVTYEEEKKRSSGL